MFYLYIYTHGNCLRKFQSPGSIIFMGPAVGFRGPVAMMAIFILKPGAIKLPNLRVDQTAM